MNRFLRILLMLKVTVMLALGSSAVWAECEDHDSQASSGAVMQGDLMLAQSESADQDQDDSMDDDASDEGDSQT